MSEINNNNEQVKLPVFTKKNYGKRIVIDHAESDQYTECVNCSNKYWIDDVRGQESITDCSFCGLPIQVSNEKFGDFYMESIQNETTYSRNSRDEKINYMLNYLAEYSEKYQIAKNK